MQVLLSFDDFLLPVIDLIDQLLVLSEDAVGVFEVDGVFFDEVDFKFLEEDEQPDVDFSFLVEVRVGCLYHFVVFEYEMF